ncbi:MAG TPA: hypothetical protein VLH10_04605 [Yinghuangia sp.]|uniref:hypothetical protein n=1 Tax=Yinghuangia sp. YIM S10712 TaxID=3436930 RepID=UPI002BC0211B|nr:hypothetical protein [Yinghuangia sp.]
MRGPGVSERSARLRHVLLDDDDARLQAILVAMEAVVADVAHQSAVSGGKPPFTGFMSVWRFPTHWIGIGVRHHRTGPPVELVALVGEPGLLAAR